MLPQSSYLYHSSSLRPQGSGWPQGHTPEGDELSKLEEGACDQLSFITIWYYIDSWDSNTIFSRSHRVCHDAISIRCSGPRLTWDDIVRPFEYNQLRLNQLTQAAELCFDSCVTELFSGSVVQKGGERGRKRWQTSHGIFKIECVS